MADLRNGGPPEWRTGIAADGDCTKEIKRRIAMARQKAVVLASIWKDRNIKTATKVKVMKSVVWAVFHSSMEWRDRLWRNRTDTE